VTTGSDSKPFAVAAIHFRFSVCGTELERPQLRLSRLPFANSLPRLPILPLQPPHTFHQCPYLPGRTSFVSRDREIALREWVCARTPVSSMVNPRGGAFTPSPAQQTIVTGVSHSPHGSHHSTFSAGASPSTNSPTGSNSLTKIVVAQVYLLLSTIKEDKDRTKWEQQAEQLRKVGLRYC
jgi:hypothetical protein